MRTKRNNLLQNSKPVSNRYVRFSMLDDDFGPTLKPYVTECFQKFQVHRPDKNIAANTVLKRIQHDTLTIDFK